MRLLVVEDSIRLATLVCEGLTARGFSADHAGTLRQADHALDLADYDALILDLGLPDGDGLVWMQRRKSNGVLPPVLILTAREALGDRVAGLDAGADDYLAKPFAFEELGARLRALLRRPGPRSNAIITVSRLTLDTVARQARCDGSDMALSRRELGLLELLMRRAGSVIDKGMIENALYNFDQPITPNAIEAIMSRLRRKLEAAGVVDMLVTLRGIGYLLKDRGD